MIIWLIFSENMRVIRFVLKSALHFKLSKNNRSKKDRKGLKELQPDTSIVVLPADNGRSTVTINREDCLKKYIDHINTGPYQLVKKIVLSKSKPRY